MFQNLGLENVVFCFHFFMQYESLSLFLGEILMKKTKSWNYS